MAGESPAMMELSYAGVCFDLFGTLVTDGGAPVDGALEALRLLPRERWAIVTSAPAHLARAIVAHAELPEPQVLVTADDVERGKPAPHPYLRGVGSLGFDASRVLAVEDSLHGIHSARAAGLDVVAIAYGRGLAFAREATAHVDRFAQIAWSLERDGSIRVRIEP